MLEKICYSHNHLSEVVCRLDFASPISELKSSMPKPIYDEVKKYYPIAEPQDVIGTELSINPVGAPMVNPVTMKQWVFLSRNRQNRCTLDTNSIIFSISEYTVFEDLRKAINGIFSAVMKNYPKNQGKRLGLRYINNLSIKGHENWIDDAFITAHVAHKNDRTTKLITTFEYAIQEKDLNVRLIYGFNNPDYPAIMKKENYIIDIDAYSTGIIYQEEIAQYIEDMHYEVQSCFERMITDECRAAMNEVE